MAMTFEEVLSVLLGWLGAEIEVSLHGADGAVPVLAAELHGRLERGDELSGGPNAAVTLLFLVYADEKESGSFLLSERAYRGGGWLDRDEEVLKIRNGAVELLITRADEYLPSH